MEHKRWPALRWGGIFGGSAVVLVAVHDVLTSAVLDDTIAMMILTGVGFFLLYLVLFFAAGALAARETGLVHTGTFAGLFAALIACAATILLGVFDTVRQPSAGSPPAGSSISPEQYRLELATIAVGVFLVVGIIFLAFGAGFGTLGGVAGRPVAPPEPAAPPEPMPSPVDEATSPAPTPPEAGDTPADMSAVDARSSAD